MLFLTTCFGFNRKKKYIGKIVMGNHSYRSKNAYVKVWHRNCTVEVGKYCSLAACGFIYDGNHNPNFASTFPFFELGSSDKAPPNQLLKTPPSVGNDVWIADDVIVHSGVTIGDGAVIAGQSVVTKDVPPYALVAGNPARIIKYRFEPDVIKRFLLVKWWDLPDKVVKEKLAPLIDKPLDFLTMAESLRVASETCKL